MFNSFPNPLTWQFLDEPMYRWAVFLLAMILILAGWSTVLRAMR